MAAIRSVEEIAKKWARVTPQRVQDYTDGISSPRVDWATATVAARPAWEAGVQAAISAGTFAKGVTRAGTEKWQTNALAKGSARWGPGVTLAEEAYRAGFAPFVEAIRRVNLPPRGARRDPRNLLRVNAIVEALVKAKQAQST